jgi:cytidylate kinase
MIVGSVAKRPRAIAILGPTGAGKSELAMRIARDLPVEISPSALPCRIT